MDNTEIVQRYKTQKGERRVVEQQWDDIRELVMPYRGRMFELGLQETSVDWRENRNVFDSTAIQANHNLAASMHGNLTSSATKWFEMTFEGNQLKKDREAVVWLSECSEIAYEELSRSPFDVQIAENYLDLTGYGTTVLFEEAVNDTLLNDEWAGLDFEAFPIKQCFFEVDTRGQVINFYRRLDWTPLQMVDKFGEDKVPDFILERAKQATASDNKEEIVFCIFKRKVGEEDDFDNLTLTAPENRPFGFKYVLIKDQETLGEEGGFYERPVFVSRWSTTSDSQWGNSPAMIALPDIKSLNQLIELGLSALEKTVDPATLTTERNLYGDLDLKSGGLTVLKDIDGLRAYESASRFDVEFAKEDQFRASINRTFFVDQLELKESPAMTATEVQVRYELMQRLMGPTLGRLQKDLLDPLVVRTFNILFRANRFPPMPESVRALKGKFKTKYVGPLAAAQTSSRVSVIDRWVAGQMELANADPEALDMVNFDAVGRERAKLLVVPPDLVRSPQESRQRKKQREDMMRKAQEGEMAQQQGDAMNSVGQGVAALQALQGGVEGA